MRRQGIPHELEHHEFTVQSELLLGQGETPAVKTRAERAEEFGLRGGNDHVAGVSVPSRSYLSVKFFLALGEAIDRVGMLLRVDLA